MNLPAAAPGDDAPDWNASSAVILVNLGSPRAATPRAVSGFLAEFLSDRRVVELPPLLWQPILRGIVIPLRARRVAHAYASIWSGDFAAARHLAASAAGPAAALAPGARRRRAVGAAGDDLPGALDRRDHG